MYHGSLNLFSFLRALAVNFLLLNETQGWKTKQSTKKSSCMNMGREGRKEKENKLKCERKRKILRVYQVDER